MNFAVIEEDKVINLIVAENKKIAESVTGLTCIQYEDTDLPHIGLGYVDGIFEQPVVNADEVPADTE